ncbi:type IV toxin-antitoxin system AbiEi family antitoxin domain-containing protein [Rhodococcus sp. HNM0569]|uniref:type IV toxin-antitoxin system AbiEi family antitoxin domain-containing protein n=1 Tax=Rhodococcus sp. HNM0569 TaxID=2716340 RepID=UPI00146B7ED9|nr:type IV toxin-antitoxin system AbiEi family antitoxin domain-containing protein [Rhodococcus sp. HNM0569]NLU85146.1 type IV toxin-antitoxin system AbiEi family antitoxin domain-containing protein [Rhodococcus sp. HNM0569]
MTDWSEPAESQPDPARLKEIADRQGGYFTTAQALRAGYRVSDVGDRIVDGSWLRVERDLFRLPGSRETDLDEFVKWCTWFGTGAAVSHQSAAELYGLGHLYPRFIHISTVLAPPSPTRALALHRRSLSADDCEQLGAVRITTPVRTALDLAAGGISQELLDEVVADGVVIGRFTGDALHDACHHAPPEVVRRIEHALAACT